MVYKDLSNLPRNLYDTGLTLLKETNLFDFNFEEIRLLQSDILKREGSDNIMSFVIAGIAIEYLLKSFMLVNNFNIFKKSKDNITDLSDGFSFINISCKSNAELEKMLKSLDIARINQIETYSFDKLIDFIDQLKMDMGLKNILKNGLNRFKSLIRNRFIHLYIGVMQISPQNFNNSYIPAFNILLKRLKIFFH